jgi:hypothetical protein
MGNTCCSAQPDADRGAERELSLQAQRESTAANNSRAVLEAVPSDPFDTWGRPRGHPYFGVDATLVTSPPRAGEISGRRHPAPPVAEDRALRDAIEVSSLGQYNEGQGEEDTALREASREQVSWDEQSRGRGGDAELVSCVPTGRSVIMLRL